MKKIIALILLTTIGISSCKKDYLSLEKNPNTPSVYTPQFLLSGSLKTTADIMNGSFSTYGVWMGFVAPSGNYVPNTQLVTYNFGTDDYQTFNPFYQNLSNYNFLETSSAGDAALANFAAIAKIMKAYGFQALVDNYGNVPYTEAFQAPVILSPKYDKGDVIYDDLLKQLDAAITLINGSASATNPGASDIVFGGDMTNWKKFANTLKLRIAIRQSNLTAKQAALKTAVNATLSLGYLDETIQAAANPGYTNSDANGGQHSPFWRVYGFDQNGNATGNNAYYRANSYAVNKLKATNDPRVERFYALIPNGTYAGQTRGNAFGDLASLQNANTSAIGPGLLKSSSMPAILLSSSEALFLQAEAANSGLITGSAQSYYEKGITASFVATGVPNAATAAVSYYSQAIENVGWAASSNKLQAIITQKWTALNGYSNLEAYNEYRRTGFPNDIPRSVASGALGTTQPYRILYPTTEYQTNAANVKAEGTIDRFATKIFWAK
jgi:hypothetical protein